MRFCLLAFALLIPAITITAVSVTVASCVAEVASEAPDNTDTDVATDTDTDTVTLQQAMESVGAADVGLFGHSIGKAAPGIPPFEDNELPADVWDAVAADVKQHYGMAHRRPIHRPRAARRSRAHHQRAKPGRSCRFRRLTMNRHSLIGTLLAVSIACSLSGAGSAYGPD